MRKIAEENHKDLNVLVSEIFQQYIAWGAGAGKAGWVPVQKSLLIAMAEHIDDEAIEKMATSTALTTDLGFLLSETGEYGPAGIVPFLKARADAADFPMTVKSNDRHTMVTIHHRMGMKWSNIFRTFYKTILADPGITVKFEVTCNTIVLLLPKQA